MNLENGKTYLINHQRKGAFAMRVDKQCETWVHGVVAGGKADAMLDYNVKLPGDNISVRIEHVRSAVEQPAGEPA